ncbi:protein of unknown function [Ralstonia solanacearum CMR15]|nr:protein of unknown function [Ralstonia solanacearum CMR15]
MWGGRSAMPDPACMERRRLDTGGHPREKKRTVLNAANKGGMDAAVAAQVIRGGLRLMR